MDKAEAALSLSSRLSMVLGNQDSKIGPPSSKRQTQALSSKARASLASSSLDLAGSPIQTITPHSKVCHPIFRLLELLNSRKL